MEVERIRMARAEILAKLAQDSEEREYCLSYLNYVCLGGTDPTASDASGPFLLTEEYAYEMRRWVGQLINVAIPVGCQFVPYSKRPAPSPPAASKPFSALPLKSL